MKLIIDTENITEKDREILNLFMRTETVAKAAFIKRHGKAKEIILQMVKERPGYTVREYAAVSEYKENSIYGNLIQLEKENLIEKSGSKPHQYYLKYENLEVKELLKNAKKVKI